MHARLKIPSPLQWLLGNFFSKLPKMETEIIRLALYICLLGFVLLSSTAEAQERRTFGNTAQSRSNGGAAETRDAVTSSGLRTECDATVENAYRDRGLDLQEKQAIEAACVGVNAGGYDYHRAVQLYYSRDTDSRLPPEKEQLFEDIRLYFDSAKAKGFRDILLIRNAFNMLYKRYLGPPSPVKQRLYSQNAGNPLTPQARAGLAAAQTGRAEAMFAYALRIASGEGVTSDQAAATFWFKEAAYKRHTKAQFIYAWRIYRGMGIEQDHSQAYYWADLAAREGNPGGLFVRGLLGWPVSSPNLFLQMIADKGFAGVFNFPNALADLDRAAEACKIQPYRSDTDYKNLCAAIPGAKEEMLRSSQGNSSPSDDYWRDESQRMWEQNQREALNQTIFDTEMQGMFGR